VLIDDFRWPAQVKSRLVRCKILLRSKNFPLQDRLRLFTWYSRSQQQPVRDVISFLRTMPFIASNLTLELVSREHCQLHGANIMTYPIGQRKRLCLALLWTVQFVKLLRFLFNARELGFHAVVHVYGHGRGGVYQVACCCADRWRNRLVDVIMWGDLGRHCVIVVVEDGFIKKRTRYDELLCNYLGAKRCCQRLITSYYAVTADSYRIAHENHKRCLFRVLTAAFSLLGQWTQHLLHRLHDANFTFVYFDHSRSLQTKKYVCKVTLGQLANHDCKPKMPKIQQRVSVGFTMGLNWL